MNTIASTFRFADLVWEVFFALLFRVLGRLSAIQRRAFAVRTVVMAALVNLIYASASALFYYGLSHFGQIPRWIADIIAKYAIQPFRATFSFKPIGWTVNIPPGNPVMTTPLVSVGSWHQYVTSLVTVSLVLALLTEPVVWVTIASFLKHCLASAGNKQLRIDKFLNYLHWL